MIKYSIIIPTFNRADILLKSLESITNLEFDKKLFEVIVIDNNSSDSTKDVVLSFETKIKNLIYVFEGRSGLVVARHLGANLAKGSVLCYLDDDAFVTKKWLLGIDKVFKDESIVLAGGPIFPIYEVKPPRWIKYFWKKIPEGKYLEELSLIDLGEKKQKIKPYFVFGCNFIIRKNVLFDLKGFNPDGLPWDKIVYRGNGEGGLADKIYQEKLNVIYSPEVKVYHYMPKTRLTSDFFLRCFYKKGVTISFNLLRTKKRSEINLKNINYNLIDLFLSFLNKDYNSYLNIKNKGYVNLKNGFDEHQKKFLLDKNFREYVLRENYLGAKGELPL
ncbi:glycosyltransferase [Candidatus Dependentiae bacterium]|nr:glycosyltransferase [Candidatus Dependentiae bacterium]